MASSSQGSFQVRRPGAAREGATCQMVEDGQGCSGDFRPLGERALEGPAAGLQRQAAAADQAAVAAAPVARVADLQAPAVLLLGQRLAAVGQEVGQRTGQVPGLAAPGREVRRRGSAKSSCSRMVGTSARGRVATKKGPPSDRAGGDPMAGPWRYPALLRARPFVIPAHSIQKFT